MIKDKRTVLCFIDDDPREVDIFKKVFGDVFNVIAHSDLATASKNLETSGAQPNLFVLDLYFSSGRDSTTKEREQMIKLQQKIEDAQREFSEYLAKIGQGRNGGINLLHIIKKHYHTVPIMFYTRKGTLEDAQICREAGALWVAKKPQPETIDPSQEIYLQLERATREQKDSLARLFACIASSNGRLKKIGKIIKFIWINWRTF